MAAICTGSGPAWTSFYFSSRIKFQFNAVMFISQQTSQGSVQTQGFTN